MRVNRKVLEELRGPKLSPEQEALLEACCAFIELAEPAELAFLNTAIRHFGRRIQDTDHSGIDAILEGVEHAALCYRQDRAKESGRAA